jgi:hypothetical protein
MLAQKYPTYKILKYIRPEDIQTLRNGSKELSIIKAKNLPPDQKLWELGQAYMRMMQVDWNMAEVGYHMNHPYSFFNEIIKNFPNSTYADNAWWTMEFSYEDWDGDYEMFFLNTMLSKYREFLAQYPSSELAPLAKYFISVDILCAVEYAEENPTYKDILPLEKRSVFLDTAKQMCSEAIQAGLTKKDTLYYSINPERKLIEIDNYIKRYRSDLIKSK